MKRCLEAWALAAVSCFLLAAVAQADPRVATVNMEKLFNEYWKTRAMNAALNQKARELDHTDHRMIADLQSARNEYQKLLDEARNQAFSSAERAKDQRRAEDQREHANKLESDIETFEQEARTTLAQQESRARKDILAGISAAIAHVARAKGYSLVVEAETQGIADDPSNPDYPGVVIYTDGTRDLTQSVLSQLNASTNAPDSNNGE